MFLINCVNHGLRLIVIDVINLGSASNKQYLIRVSFQIRNI